MNRIYPNRNLTATERTQRYHKKVIAQGRCLNCAKDKGISNSKIYCAECLVKYKQKAMALRKRYWNLILDAYGRKCACPKCPETNEKFLTIDHVNDNGADHRRRLKHSNLLYKEVIKSNFSKEYRLLCHNCNSGRARYKGICPHMEIENDSKS